MEDKEEQFVKELQKLFDKFGFCLKKERVYDYVREEYEDVFCISSKEYTFSIHRLSDELQWLRFDTLIKEKNNEH